MTTTKTFVQTQFVVKDVTHNHLKSFLLV